MCTFYYEMNRSILLKLEYYDFPTVRAESIKLMDLWPNLLLHLHLFMQHAKSMQKDPPSDQDSNHFSSYQLHTYTSCLYCWYLYFLRKSKDNRKKIQCKQQVTNESCTTFLK